VVNAFDKCLYKQEVLADGVTEPLKLPIHVVYGKGFTGAAFLGWGGHSIKLTTHLIFIIGGVSYHSL
jgi:hypothetical protein